MILKRISDKHDTLKPFFSVLKNYQFLYFITFKYICNIEITQPKTMAKIAL